MFVGFLVMAEAFSGGATLWQGSANALPVRCNALPLALPVL